ncbi:phosphatidylinositol-specific phospholipase C domain-containing protein [Bacillus mycoides]|uniref:phosphatidylinositol-specific phospholipase C domain-containing protein n=1 Tax=Bacillus mycoides TaxID=1405 RepID=UPI0037F8C35D
MLKNKKSLASMSVLFTILFSSIGAQETLAAFTYSDWMKDIPDSRKLAELSIPGTHDSGTFRLTESIKSVWSKTQEHDFRYQMDHGVRFFDIRGCVEDNNTIVLYHGPIFLHVTLHEFIEDAKSFLKDYPSETIIMSLKEENKSGGNDAFATTFENQYFRDPIFLKTEGNITLEDSRGKIVLLRRYSGSRMAGGFRDFVWKNNETFTSRVNGHMKVTVQDKYNVTYEKKKEAIDSMLNETIADATNSEHIHINFTSLSSGGAAWSSPYYYASYLNSFAASKVKHENLKKPGAKAGWVVMDYLGDRWDPKLSERVILANFPSFPLR